MNDIDKYISQFPENIRLKLEEIRAIIIKAVPNAEEVISYKMPAYKTKEVLVYFAGYNKHIGFYPTGKPIIAFAEELKKYKTSKGAIQFSLDKPMPKTLIASIVKYRVKQVAEKQGQTNNIFSKLSKPAQRALQAKGINSLKILSNYTLDEVLNLHGIGKTTIPILEDLLKLNKLSFKK